MERRRDVSGYEYWEVLEDVAGWWSDDDDH